MIKNGIGGCKTVKNGLCFEEKTYLADLLLKKGYPLQLIENKKIKSKIKGYQLIEDGVPAIIVTRGARIYKDIESLYGVNVRVGLSGRLWPDDALIDIKNGIVYILEKKFQSTKGSVDEKLQTCDFKKKQYQKMFEKIGLEVKYTYVCCDFFKKDKYRDVVEYI